MSPRQPESAFRRAYRAGLEAWADLTDGEVLRQARAACADNGVPAEEAERVAERVLRARRAFVPTPRGGN